MASEVAQQSGGFAPAVRGVTPVREGATRRGEVAFKDLLRLARLEQGLSFHQLAERSQVDVAYLHRLEDGQAAHPGRNVAIRIAIGLGLDLDDTEELLLASRHVPLRQGSPPTGRLADLSADSHSRNLKGA
jgi:transcriptional regulator with XRE-family HTH domain